VLSSGKSAYNNKSVDQAGSVPGRRWRGNHGMEQQPALQVRSAGSQDV
jgi:hypothetical protein